MSADWINYHHLLYFWTVAKQGSIAAACEKLRLAQPTISGQLKKLERQIGGKLYERVGRNLVLTELGQVVFKYADEMFAIGNELSEVLKGRPSGRPVNLHVGVPDVFPRLVVFRLLKPALKLETPVKLICHEGSQEKLLAQLAAHELDVVFSDAPASSVVRVKAFNHSLGRSAIGLFGTQKLIDEYGGDFPARFHNAPVMLPGEGTALRRSVDQWLYESQSSVQVIGEFDDTALMKVFAEAHTGFIPAPMAIEQELLEQFSLRSIFVLPNAKEEFFAITVERKLTHPAVKAITEIARADLFAN